MSLNQSVPSTSTERIDVYACTRANWTHDKPPAHHTTVMLEMQSVVIIN